MYLVLNLASLILGLAAWCLPQMAFLRSNDHGRHLSFFLAASGLCCSISLLLQLVYARHLTAVQDWSALLDTAGAVVAAGVVLTAGTFLSHLLALLRSIPPCP